MLTMNSIHPIAPASRPACMDVLPTRMVCKASYQRVRASAVSAVEEAGHTQTRPQQQRARSIRRVLQCSTFAAPPPFAASAASTRKRQHRRAVGITAAALLGPGGAGAEAAVPEPLPEGLRIEPATDGAQTDVEYDAGANMVRVPLSALDGGRRTKLVMFTCNRCGGRTARLTNPLAWEKGAVFARCQHCDVWHTLAANNPKIIEEIRYDDPEGQKRRREAFYAASQQQQQQEEASSGSGDSDGTVVFGGDEGGVDSSSSSPASPPPQQPIV